MPEPIDPQQLLDPTERMKAARERFIVALENRQAETNKPRSLWSKLKDEFSDTPAEQERQQARQDFRKARLDVFDQTQDWVDTRVVQLCQDAGMEGKRVLRARDKFIEANERANTFAEQSQWQYDTIKVVKEAMVACRVARDAEAADLFSKNGLISMMSSSDMKKAGEKIQVANKALETLRQKLPHDALSIPGAPNDTLDLAIDLVGGMDFMSALNLQDICTAKEACEKVKTHLEALMIQTLDRHATARGAADEAERPFREMERPFRKQALAELPQEVRMSLENGGFKDMAPATPKAPVL